nr:unnamed protein product [Digitaria exilis]
MERNRWIIEDGDTATREGEERTWKERSRSETLQQGKERNGHGRRGVGLRFTCLAQQIAAADTREERAAASWLALSRRNEGFLRSDVPPKPLGRIPSLGRANEPPSAQHIHWARRPFSSSPNLPTFISQFGSPPHAAMAPPPELVDDAITEILLRLPPDDPALLFRASVVCRSWRRIISSASFLRSYRRFHRSPPLLALLVHDPISSRFIPTTYASPFNHLTAASYYHGRSVLDCRHGRVLLKDPMTRHFVVRWEDLVTGVREEVISEPGARWFATAVLCAVPCCDHCDCHAGPYLVLCMRADHIAGFGVVVHARAYSSQSGSWGTSVFAHVGVGPNNVTSSRRTLVGDEMFSTLALSVKILRYNFTKNCLSVIHSPVLYADGNVLMVTEDGSLGLCGIRDFNLHLWSRKAIAEGVEQWVEYRVIDLLPLVINPFTRISVTGYAESACVIFLTTDIGAFIIELKTWRARKMWKLSAYIYILAAAIPNR